MRVWSLTPFLNELDVLEIRLATLDPVVDVHVIAEATRTYSGEPKPLHFAENLDRFRRWQHKIRYVIVDDMPEGDHEPHVEIPTSACASDRWARENHQRNALERGIDTLDPDDVLLLSDVDEIPRPGTFPQALSMARSGHIARPRLAMHVYRMTWRWPEALPVIARFFNVDTFTANGRSCEAVRQYEGTVYGTAAAAGEGWHLSYLGGADAIRYKLRVAAHHELDIPAFNTHAHAQISVDEGRDLFNRGHRNAQRCAVVELPGYVQAHRDRFTKIL